MRFVYKESAVSRRWGCQTLEFGIEPPDKGQIPAWRDNKFDVSGVSPWSEGSTGFRYDEGLTLETSSS